jgi:hypothetical protein
MKRLLLALLMCIAGHTLFAQCHASATMSMAPLNTNLLRLQFNNTSTYTTGATKYANFYINWGDATGGYVSMGNNYHNYSSPGTKHITMILYNWDSTSTGQTLYCSDTLTDSFQVAYTPCATSFAAVVSGSAVTVTATNPAGTSGMTYSWNWGDGSPNGSGNPATHTYALSGTKAIVLTATNGTCTYTCTVSVTIGTSNPCANAHANFSTNATGGLNVIYTNVSSNLTSTYKTSYWSFGDGNTSTSTSPSHVYASTGNYNVCLVTKWYDSTNNTLKCMDSICKTITVSTTNNQIYGTIFQDSSNGPQVDSPIYDVWLIKFDAVTNMLTAQDSIRVFGTYYYATNFAFSNAPAGTYRVKAKLINGPTTGTTYVPTYHVSSLMWNTATTFNHYGGITSNEYIMLQKGTATSGPGFVAGNVSAGANKGTSGSGLEGINMFLLDANSNPVQYAVTDANGDYSFSNLPPAGYSVYPEAMNFATTPALVTVTNGNATHTGIDFSRSISQMSITPIAAGVMNTGSGKIAYGIYPNPAKDKITIQWNTNVTANADITVTDVTGKKVFSTSVTTNNNTEINLGNLQRGLYFINIVSDKMHNTEKILLQ